MTEKKDDLTLSSSRENVTFSPGREPTKRQPRQTRVRYPRNPAGNDESKSPKLRKEKADLKEGTRDELLIVSKQNSFTSVTQTWLDKYRHLISENSLNWEFPFKKQVHQYYAPFEFMDEMDLLVSTDQGVEAATVCLEVNGHVLRLYDGPYREVQDIIITFDLKEISVAVCSQEGSKEKLIIISRYHSRVFLCAFSNPNPKVTMSDIYSIIQINMDWARKYSEFKYPEKLTSTLWKDTPYIQRAPFHSQNSDTNLGTISINGQELYGILSPEDGKPGVSLFVNQDDPIPKTRAKLAIGVSIWPKYGSIMQSIVFFIICGKRAFQMHDINGLERLFINCNMDKYVTAKFEAKILASISRYAKITTPIEYRHHPHLYKLIPKTVAEPIDPSKTALRFRLDAVAQTPRGSYTDGTPGVASTPDTHKIEMLQTSMETIMDKMTMIVSAVTEMQTQIDNVETMQTQMADIMDMESQRVQNVEQKMESVGTAVNSDTMEHFDVVLDRLDYLELKIEDTQHEMGGLVTIKEYNDLLARISALEAQRTSPGAGTPEPSNARSHRYSLQFPPGGLPQFGSPGSEDILTNFRKRLEVLEGGGSKGLSPNRRQSDSTTMLLTVMTDKIKFLEGQLLMQQNLNQTWQQQMDQINDKLTKLATVCQNLNSRMKNQ